MGNGATECGWCHKPEAFEGFSGFWRRLTWVLPREKTVDFCLLAEALRRMRICCGGGDKWQSQNRKNVYLSPYVEEPLNSKVIKSFVPELRSRKCFSCFKIPMFYVYMLWTFYVRFAYPYMAMVQYYSLWSLENDEHHIHGNYFQALLDSEW